jgi:hypothetical protein
MKEEESALTELWHMMKYLVDKHYNLKWLWMVGLTAQNINKHYNINEFTSCTIISVSLERLGRKQCEKLSKNSQCFSQDLN